MHMEQFESMYNYGLKIHNDAELIKDSIQELWAKRENIGEAASIKFYQLKSVKKKIIKSVNKLNLVSSISDLDEQYNFSLQYAIEYEIIRNNASK